MSETTATRVGDLMSTEMVTLLENDRLSIAEDIMSLCRIRHLPVLDEDGGVVGVLSQRDLLYGALANVLGYGSSGRRKLVSNVFVKEVMTGDPAVIGPDAPIQEAARIMRDRKIGCLPVMERGRLVGILTEGDFVAHYAESIDDNG